MTRTLFRVGALAGILILAADGRAFAGSTTSNITVTATVLKNCSITAGTVSFGGYDQLAGTPLDATGTFTITCPTGTAYTVGLGSGANAQGATRRMASSGQFLTYEFYQDSTRSTIWTDTGSGMLAGTTPNSSPVTLTIYGRIPPSQTVTPGGYSDTVVATVNF